MGDHHHAESEEWVDEDTDGGHAPPHAPHAPHAPHRHSSTRERRTSARGTQAQHRRSSGIVPPVPRGRRTPAPSACERLADVCPARPAYTDHVESVTEQKTNKLSKYGDFRIEPRRMLYYDNDNVGGKVYCYVREALCVQRLTIRLRCMFKIQIHGVTSLKVN